VCVCVCISLRSSVVRLSLVVNRSLFVKRLPPPKRERRAREERLAVVRSAEGQKQVRRAPQNNPMCWEGEEAKDDDADDDQQTTDA